MSVLCLKNISGCSKLLYKDYTEYIRKLLSGEPDTGEIHGLSCVYNC